MKFVVSVILMIGGVFGFLAGFQTADAAAHDSATYTVTAQATVNPGATETKDRKCGYQGSGDNRRYSCHNVYRCEYSYTYVHNNDSKYSGDGRTERRSSCLSSFSEGSTISVWYDPKSPANHVTQDPNGFGKALGPWAFWIIGPLVFLAGAAVGVYAFAERRSAS